MLQELATTNRMIARTLGRYEIIQRLAVGGMAEIFLARSTAIQGFQKYVVLKRILPQFARNPHFVSMFLDEARLAARLNHQNIAQVYDFGEEDGSYYLVMEYLHGENLLTLLRSAVKHEKPIPLKHVLAIVNSVAAGLEYAHNARDDEGAPLHIVHRDVAPSNIIVTYDGGVKLVDFGISRARSHRNETESGIIKGKISYMSPEQIRSKDLDGRSDLFALGIVLYELTTMSRLFPVGSDDRFEVMKRIMQGKIPRPSRRAYHYPPRLEKIVMRALSLDPAYRYQTASEMLADLERFAARKRLTLSPSELGRYVRRLAGYRPEPWRRGGRDEGGESSGSEGSKGDTVDWRDIPQPRMEAPLQAKGASGRLPTLLPLPTQLPGDPGELPRRDGPVRKPVLRLVESMAAENAASDVDEAPPSETMRLVEDMRPDRTRLVVGVILALLGIMGVLTLVYLRGDIVLPGLPPWTGQDPFAAAVTSDGDGTAGSEAAAEEPGVLVPDSPPATGTASVEAVSPETASVTDPESDSDTESESATETESATDSDSESEAESASATGTESPSSEKPDVTEPSSEADNAREQARKRRARNARRKARRARVARQRAEESLESRREWTTDDLFPPSASE